MGSELRSLNRGAKAHIIAGQDTNPKECTISEKIIHTGGFG